MVPPHNHTVHSKRTDVRLRRRQPSNSSNKSTRIRYVFPKPCMHHANLTVAGFIGGGFDFRTESTQLANLKTQLAEARSILDLAENETLPLGVGFITFQSEGFVENVIPILWENRVAAVWLSFPKDDEDHEVLIRAIRRCRDWDVKLFVQVGTVRAAETAVGQGVDGLVVQGTDAGGHQWARGAGLISLVPEVRDLVNARNATTVVLAAGGIVDGRGCVAALGLGWFLAFLLGFDDGC
jgi:nitronate monooxygenase